MRRKRFASFLLSATMLLSIGSIQAPETDYEIVQAETASSTTASYDPDTEFTTNFDGVKKTVSPMGTELKQYFINTNKWKLGSRVSLSSYQTAGSNGCLKFLNCVAKSVVSPMIELEDFVCRFKIKALSADMTPDGANIGLSFNLTNAYDNAEVKNNISFVKSSKGTAVRITNGYMDKAEAGQFWFQYEEEDAIDIWSSTPQWINVMVVKVGGTAKVYFAEEGDTVGMEKCRATLTGVDGHGYLAFCGNLAARFSLDDVSVIPLIATYKQGVSNLTYSNNVASTKEQVLVAKNEIATTTDSYADAVSFYKVKRLFGSLLSLQFGNQMIYINSQGQIRSYDKNMALVSGGTVDFSLLKAGCELRVVALGSWVDVSINTENGYTTIAEFQLNETIGAGNSGIAASADSTVLLEGIETKTLAGVIQIETRDFDPILDRDPIHEKDISFNEYYGIKES